MANQGFVDFSGNSLLENAERSFDVKAGGVVRSLHTTVRNGGRAKFSPYSGFNTWSNFKHTDFVIDGDTYPFSQFKEHVFLENIKAVSFNYCDFITVNLTLLPASIRKNLTAINSLDASFVVSNSKFDGFYKAIAAGTGLGIVKNSTFKNSFYSIESMGVDFFTMFDNDFEVKSNYPYPSQTDGRHVGLSMENSTGYFVKENTFTGVAGLSAHAYGILVENSGGAGNLVEGNYFNFLAVANQAQGNNRGLNAGLQYLCNYNLGANTKDFLVVGDGTGIAEFQGAGLATRNTFSHNTSIPTDSDFRNEANVVTYFHSLNPAETPDFPTGLLLDDVLDGNTCPGEVSPGPIDVCCEELTPGEEEEHTLAFNAAKNSYDEQLAAYNGLLDGGDTQGHLTAIAGVSVANRAQVKQSLLADSPFLSYGVLAAVIHKSGVFTEQGVIYVLSANPDQIGAAETKELLVSELSGTASQSILSALGAFSEGKATATPAKASHFRFERGPCFLGLGPR